MRKVFTVLFVICVLFVTSCRSSFQGEYEFEAEKISYSLRE